MKAQFEVSETVWGRVKVAAMLSCKSIGEVLEPVLETAFPAVKDAPYGKPPKTSTLPVVESKVKGDDEVRVQPPKPAASKSPFKYTPDTCPGHKWVNVGGASRCMNCGGML